MDVLSNFLAHVAGLPTGCTSQTYSTEYLVSLARGITDTRVATLPSDTTKAKSRNAEPELLTVREAAKLLALKDHHTLYDASYKRMYGAVQVGSRQWRYPRAKVMKELQRRGLT